MICNVSSSLRFFEFTCNMTSIILMVMWAPLSRGTVFPWTMDHSLFYYVWEVPTSLLKCHSVVLSSGKPSLTPQTQPPLLSALTTLFAFISLTGLKPTIVIYKWLSLVDPKAVKGMLILLILCLENHMELMFVQQTKGLHWYLGPTFKDSDLIGLGSSLGIGDLKWSQGREPLLSVEVNTCTHARTHAQH